MKKVRTSNIELLRIVAMFMIILYHLTSGIRVNATGTAYYFFIFLQCLLIVHVNSFVLITGGYASRKDVKMGKFLSLYNQVWFYKALIPIVLYFLGLISFEFIPMLKAVSPLYYGDYWYMTVYFCFLLFTPILNVVIRNIDKEKHKKIILLLFLIFSILPFLTQQEFFPNNRGFSLTNFILLYFIGSYLTKYPIENSHVFKGTTANLRKIVFLGGYFFLGLVNALLNYASFHFLNLGTIMNAIGNMLQNATYTYDNPLVILQSVCFFLFFYSLDMKPSKIINRLGGLTLGVYLIHENRFLKPIMLSYLKLDTANESLKYVGSSIIFKCLFYTLAILVICFIIEFIRQVIFKFIYNRKVSNWWRKKYRGFIASLGISINW